MDITEVLQFADSLIFDQTGQYLDDLQKIIIKGVWEGKTYEQIGKDSNRSESRVRDVGYKLLQVLSESLGEDITKRNFRSTIERLKAKSSSIINIASHLHCSFQTLNSNKNYHLYNDENLNSNSIYLNLKFAPTINQFYGRETELSTLAQWIENPHAKLISILGIKGIGKTALVKHFIDTHSLNFDAIIWKNLKISPHFEANIVDILENNIINTHSNNYHLKTKLSQFFNLLQTKKCLIIFDDIQELFTLGQFVGQYRPEYQDYQSLFQMVTTLEHQSCLILISQEKCQEMISLSTELYPSYCLELQGLDESAKFILLNQRLKDEETWLEFIKLYQGNPQYLQLISILIKEIFQDKVSELMQENELILTDDLKALLETIWLRLSNIEQEILQEIIKHNQPVSRENIQETFSLSSTAILGGLQSLKRRFLLTQLEGNSTLFKLPPVFQEYLKQRNQ